MDELIEAAKEALTQAYAPYSGYPVGAAVEDERGRIHRGCNVENVSFPAGLCAERVAVGAMVADGGRHVRGLAVVTRDGGTPCGCCLQVLMEFSDLDKTKIFLVGSSGSVKTFSLRELLPHGFSSKLV